LEQWIAAPCRGDIDISTCVKPHVKKVGTIRTSPIKRHPTQLGDKAHSEDAIDAVPRTIVCDGDLCWRHHSPGWIVLAKCKCVSGLYDPKRTFPFLLINLLLHFTRCFESLWPSTSGLGRCACGGYGFGPRYAGSDASVSSANELVPSLGDTRTGRFPESDLELARGYVIAHGQGISDRIFSSGILRLRTPADTLRYSKSSAACFERHLLLYCTLLQRGLLWYCCLVESQCDGMLRA
jgi:hypothetical protein